VNANKCAATISYIYMYTSYTPLLPSSFSFRTFGNFRTRHFYRAFYRRGAAQLPYTCARGYRVYYTSVRLNTTLYTRVYIYIYRYHYYYRRRVYTRVLLYYIRARSFINYYNVRDALIFCLAKPSRGRVHTHTHTRIHSTR